MENAPCNRRHSEGWIGGAVLIALGIIFFLQNTAGIELNNWWALFILIPALGSFGAAWRAYEKDGRRITGTAIGPFMGGVILSARRGGLPSRTGPGQVLAGPADFGRDRGLGQGDGRAGVAVFRRDL